MTALAAAGGVASDPSAPAGPPPRPRPEYYAAALAGSWLLPLAAQAVHADWIVLLVAWGAVASLLRAGARLVDRLVLSGILLAGFLIAAGLLFMVWPWGLRPVLVGGVTLTAITLAGMASGRRPRIPLRLVPTDALILGAAYLSWHYLNAPTRGKSFAERLPYIAAREDLFNQYSLYDTIYRIGGYPFLKQHGFYPPGSHYLDVLLDEFLRSSNHPVGGTAEYLRFIDYSILNAAVLAAIIVWAARWVAGPGLAGWRSLAVCTIVGGLAAVGQLSTLYWQGYHAEVAGLVVLALATAVIVRPPRQVREQILLICAIVITSTFVYNLTALMVMGMAGIAALVYWRRLLAHWKFAVLVGVPSLVVALLPYIFAMAASFSESNQFLAWGTSVRFSRTMSVVFALAGVSAMAARNGRRSPVWRTAALSVTWCCALTVGMGYYAYTKLGITNYYYEKLVEGVWVVCLVCVGSAGMLLKPGPVLGAVSRFGRRSEGALAGALSMAMLLVTAGVIQLTTVRFPNWVPKQDVSWGSVWRAGYISSGFSAPLSKMQERHMLADDITTVVIYFDNGHDNRSATTFVSSLNHDRDKITQKVIDGLVGSDHLGTARFPKPGKRLPAPLQQSLDNLTALVRQSPVPLRLAIWDHDVADYMQRFSTANPQLGLQIVRMQ